MDESNVVKSDKSHTLTSRAPLPVDTVAANEPLAGDTIEPENPVGDLLRAAREKAGMSHGDIASRLRMGVKQVRALEQGDFAALPTGTFLRGFVRNFAKEVGVEPGLALASLEQFHRDAAAVSASAVVIPSQQNIKVPVPGREFSTPRARAFLVASIAGVLLALFGYWWEYVRPYLAEGGRPKAVAEGTATSVPVPVPAPTAGLPAPEAGGLQEKGAAQEPAPTADTSSMPSQPPASVAVSSNVPAERADLPPPAPRPVLSAGSGSLGFTFTGESWVEVTDGNGKMVLSRKFKGGEAEEVVGRAPFSVVIGNAQVTRMAHNGKEVDLAPHTRVSVARMTVK